jgi:hypothetical protein
LRISYHLVGLFACQRRTIKSYEKSMQSDQIKRSQSFVRKIGASTSGVEIHLQRERFGFRDTFF